MPGHNRHGNRSVSGKSDGKIKQTNAEPKMKTKIVTEGLQSVLKNVKLDDNYYCNFKNLKQNGGKPNGKDDGNRELGDKDNGSNKMQFDICPKRDTVKLKAPLHVLYKERRSQFKQRRSQFKRKGNVYLRPGMVLMNNYISIDDQISIVKTCRELGVNNGGFYQPYYSDRTKLHLKMMCLGKNWDPESKLYSLTRPVDNAETFAIPKVFNDMVIKAIQDSNAYIVNQVPEANVGALNPLMVPDICVVNFYSESGKLGFHQDEDESEMSLKNGLPVVSFSIGDSAEFLYGETRDPDEAEKLILESGDVLVFGGKSRHIFHGVSYILPDTAPTSLIESTNMCPGRLNLTFRKY